MRSKLFLTPLALAGLALAGCDSDSSGPEQQGQLTIQLTDAPGDLAEAFIQIDHFVLLRSGSDDDNDDDNGDGDDNGDDGRIELQPEVGGYIDLLMLTGGQALDIVDDARVPTGSYSELRLVLDEAYVRLEDGRVFATAGADLPAGVTADGTLKCPSCSQSGFKVKFMGDGLTVEDDAAVLIDFDVAQSFGHEAGQSGQWIMRPVLRATTHNVQLGRIVGNVTLGTGVALPLCGGQTSAFTHFRPFAVSSTGADTITAAVDAEGAFRISNLMPGTYTLGSWTDISFTDGDTLSFAATASPATVTVAEGDSAMAAYVVNTATCR